jgi:hypothetical protein
MVAFLKKLFLNLEGKVSWTKISGWILSTAGSVLALAQAGVIHLSQNMIAALIVVLFVGGKIGIDGLRDAMGKK